ncbi:hypothetical protein DFJ43DRAFT_1043896 [Lentinula guzmanii]|uniref:DUF6697 domain-containing protein n=1 Tax=Lentinula guzmanii TaxID=2804957 RepID=A0AA38J2K5_9AGAR|nr:hypothetical protein DFJ43DRAFT_1043896 [Lentinula guzmanii]
MQNKILLRFSATSQAAVSEAITYPYGNDLILLVHFPVAIRELCLIIPNFDRHPNLMREPGDSGILFTARPERELTLESCSVFVKKESNNLNALWDYMGEYKIFQREKWVERCMEEGDMSSCLRSRSTVLQVQRSIEKDIAEKAKWHKHYYRERIAHRLGFSVAELQFGSTLDGIGQVRGKWMIVYYDLRWMALETFMACE